MRWNELVQIKGAVVLREIGSLLSVHSTAFTVLYIVSGGSSRISEFELADINQPLNQTMTPKNNPFHRWLGLKPEVTNPHHFQLLGVSAKLVDQAKIAAAVSSGVKRNLSLLAKVPPGKYDPLVAKLKSRISVAEKTLLDPELRADYKKQLKARIAAGNARRSAATSSLAPSPQSAPAVGPPKFGEQQAMRPSAQPAPSTAVPLAIPLKQQPSVPASNVAAPAPAQQPRFESPNDSKLPLDEPVVIRRSRRRKKKSLAPIFGVLMLGLAVGGGYLFYPDIVELVELRRQRSADSADLTTPAADPESQPHRRPSDPKQDVGEARGNPTLVETTKPSSEQETMLAKLPEESITAVKSIAEPVAVRRESALPDVARFDLAEGSFDQIDDVPNARSMTRRTRKKVDEKKREGAVEFQADAAMDPTFFGEPVPDASSSEMEFDEVSFDPIQSTSVRRNMERAYRSLYRREFAVAKRCARTANVMLGSVKKFDTDQFPPRQQLVASRISDFEKLAANLEGFWVQVAKSAKSTSVMNITVGTQTVGFVEAKPESVIVRHAGVNIEYDYSFCPPGLAVAIAETVAVEDIPTWNLQKATFYSIDQLGGHDHSRKIEEFLAIAEAAGHNCEHIRRLDPLDFGDLGRTEERVRLGSRILPAVKQFRDRQGYRRPQLVKGQQAYDLAESIFDSDLATGEQRLGLLEEARQLAIKAGAASLAEDTIIEQEKVGEINHSQVACDTFTSICGEELDRTQVRQLLERGIRYLKSPLSESAEPKSKADLKDLLLQLANRYQMLDAHRRLEQLEI